MLDSLQCGAVKRLHDRVSTLRFLPITTSCVLFYFVFFKMQKEERLFGLLGNVRGNRKPVNFCGINGINNLGRAGDVSDVSQEDSPQHRLYYLSLLDRHVNLSSASLVFKTRCQPSART